MNKFLICRAVLRLLVVVAVFSAMPSFAALLVNYQFETVDGAVPSQTTPDSSGNFVSSPTVNALLGPGTTPGTDYPVQISGVDLVANGSVKSLNPNNAMSFQGTISGNITRVSIAKASAGALDTSLANFTVAAWVRPTSTTTDRYLTAKIGGGTGSSNRGWQLYSPDAASIVHGSGSTQNTTTTVGGDDLVIDYFQNQSGSGNPNRSLVVHDVLPLNTWTHVAFAFDGVGGTEGIYINGVSVPFVNVTTTLTVLTAINGVNGSAYMVGTRGGTNATNTTTTGWIGGIDDVRVYNETLATSAPGSQTGVGSLVVPIPEPSGLVLAVIALGGSIAYRRRRGNRRIS
jgi:hypothetical protein